MNTQNYNVNLRVGIGIAPKVRMSQGDVGRELAFNIYDGVARFSPPSSAVVKIKGTKPSGLGFNVACALSGNVARVLTTLDMTQEGGAFPVELEISNGNTVIGTANFAFYVEPSPHPAGTTDGTTEEARTVLAQCEAYAQIAQEAAEAASGDYTEIREDVDDLSADVSQLSADLEDLDERVEALEEGGSGGSGLTESIKTALMNVVNHIAWDDDDPTGQTYITALYDALYPPAPPASLTSITAVYTQSGTVYDTDTLNDLKSDLVVTAHYSDSTSHAVTDYTLSGTLAVGTSVIAVNYNGKSTTFSVTVTAIPYSFHEGIFTGDSSYTNIEIEVSGGHFHVTNTSGQSRSLFVDEDSFGKTMQSGTMFSLSAGDEYEFKIKNIVFASNQNSNNSFTCTFRNPSDTNVCSITTRYSQTTGGTLPDASSTGTIETSTDVTCLKLVTTYSCEYEFDFEFWVNGERWI